MLRLKRAGLAGLNPLKLIPVEENKRTANILSMINKMNKKLDNDNGTSTILTTFTILTDLFKEFEENYIIKNIEYYEIFSISGSINKSNGTTFEERPIVYVKSITTRNKKIHDDISRKIDVKLAFYRSTGTSRHDQTITNFWFPTTKITTIGEIIITKLESSYVSKYEPYKYKSLSEDPTEIIEQENILKYGRYINLTNALIGYFLHINNNKINEDSFDKVSDEYFKSHVGDIIYEMLIPGKPLLILPVEQTGGKIQKRKLNKRKTHTRKLHKRKLKTIQNNTL